MFRDTPVDALAQNYLVIARRSPTRASRCSSTPRCPAPSIRIDGVEMKFRYKDYFKAEPSTGYETLIYDCMIGDNILFQRADSVEAGWQAVQPFLDAWKKAGADGLQTYTAGSEGPAEANDAADARRPQLAKARLRWRTARPRALIVMGVSGSGKSTIAEAWPNASAGASRMATGFIPPATSPR